MMILLLLLLPSVFSHPLTPNDLSNEISLSSYTEPKRPPRIFLRMTEATTSKPKYVKQWIGARLELECEAVGSPPPRLQWFRGQTALTEAQADYDDDQFETNAVEEQQLPMSRVKSRLVISYLLPLHDGAYTCVAKNGAYTLFSRTQLAVAKPHGFRYENISAFYETKVLGHHPPRVSLWAGTYFESIGRSVNLPCRAWGNPIPQIEWTDNEGRVVGEEVEGRVTALPDGSLSIRALSWKDMGMYKCTAKNMVDEDSVHTFVYPMKPPTDTF